MEHAGTTQTRCTTTFCRLVSMPICAIAVALAGIASMTAFLPARAWAAEQAPCFWVLFGNEDVILGAGPESPDRSRLTLLLLFRDQLPIRSDDAPSRVRERTSELSSVAVDCQSGKISVTSFNYRDAAGTLFRGVDDVPVNPAYKQDLVGGILTFACRREVKVAVQTLALTGDAFERWARPFFKF